MSDNNGNILENYRYTAFGEVETYNPAGQKITASAIDNTVTWNSRRYDFASGLHYYKYRHYAPILGRWLGRDPIEEDGGINLYAFVHNQPTKWFDYLGLQKLNIGDKTALGNFSGDGPKGSNCSSYARCGGGNTFHPIFPAKPSDKTIDGFEDCTLVVSKKECKDTDAHVIIYVIGAWGKDVDIRGVLYKGYHVIGEGCAKPGTYKHQTGEGNKTFNGIKDPDTAAYNYFFLLWRDHYKKSVTQPTRGNIQKANLCCPCLCKAKKGK